MTIRKLSKDVANKIAAGEVVERPASCVKELVENSIDAQAKNINVSIRNGGLKEILVEDDGIGMDKNDATLAFERHATSKIYDANDLFTIKSLGFRGEALPSIASVSQINMITKTLDQETGYEVILDGGEIQEVKEVGAPKGTSILVRNLFFNTPARLKYLSTERTESRRVTQIISKLALARPDISFSLTIDDRTILMTNGSGDMLDAIAKIIGVEYAKRMIKVEKEMEGAYLSGYIAPSDMAKSGREDQYFSVNGRPFVAKEVYSATDRATEFLLTAGRKLPLVYSLQVDPSMVDVNVHPAKTEVRFSNDRMVYSLIYNATQNALQSKGAIVEMDVTPEKPPVYSEDVRSVNQYEDIDKLFSTSDQSSIPIFKSSFEDRYSADYTQIIQNEADNRQHIDVESRQQVAEGSVRYNALDLKVIGQIGKTYIIVQHPDGMYIIDQHVAHERILVEYLRKRESGRECESQSLLIPEVIELSPRMFGMFKEHSQVILSIGFDVEDFGGNSVVLRKVPLIPGSFSDPVPLFLGALEDISELSVTTNESIYDALIISMSCKGAVKAGMYLDISFMQKLVEDLFETSQPFNCPHGRPIVLNLTYEKLAKNFKRI